MKYTGSIRDRIAKLLALSESPNEGEATAALLKARDLMAEYKLRPEDCTRSGGERVRKEHVGLAVSKTKYSWAIDMSAIIAERYCCRAYRTHREGERMYEIGLVGLADDFEICKRIFLYAFDCCRTKADEIFQEAAIHSTQFRRSLAEAYGRGFCKGLIESFDRQTREKPQEWGLVLAVPQAVQDEMKAMKKGDVFKRDVIGGTALIYEGQGYNDGKEFDPSSRIERGMKPQLALR